MKIAPKGWHLPSLDEFKELEAFVEQNSTRGASVSLKSVMGWSENYGTGLKTARAWAIKEMAGRLWDYVSPTCAERAWKKLLGWMSRSRLEPMKELVKTIKTHFYGIMNAIRLKADNADAESLNTKIQKIKNFSCGFRNKERFKNAIYFYLGGLDLYPA